MRKRFSNPGPKYGGMSFINHVEFKVTNLKRAAKFYRGLFGFKVRMMSKYNYALWTAKRGPRGGFFKVKNVRHGSTTVVFQVDSIERYQMKAKKLGGRVFRRKMPLPGGMGFYGAINDPFGNTIGLWSKR